MKRGDSLLRLRRFRVDEMKRQMATLDSMKLDAEHKLADLEDSVVRERQRAGDSDIGRLAFPSFLRSIEVRRENLRATQIMMQRMETIRLYTWSQLNNTNSYLKPTFVELYDPLGQTNQTSGAIYVGQVDLSMPGTLPPAYQTNMRAVTVSIYWTNYNGTKKIVRSRQAQTYVARYGMQNYIYGSR